MKSTLRLNVKIIPIIGVIAFIMEIIDPSRVWVILTIGFGGACLACYWWVRGLARLISSASSMWVKIGPL